MTGNKLADAIALKRKQAAGGGAEQTPGAPTSQAAAVAERMRQDQTDPSGTVLFVSQIEVRKQVRTKFKNIESLAKSIQEDGLQQPIIVKQLDQFRYLLIAGERRLRAVRDVLGLDTIAARVADRVEDEQRVRIIQLTENVQREDLEPLDLAREIATLKEAYGWTNRAIAERLAVHESWISKKLSLLDAPEEVRARIAAGELSETEYYNNKSAAVEKAKRPASEKSDDVRTPMVSITLSTATTLAELLKVLAEKHGGNPVSLGAKPTKKEVIAVLTTRAKDLLRLIG